MECFKDSFCTLCILLPYKMLDVVPTGQKLSILVGWLREVVDIYKMQYGFMTGRWTVYTMFGLWRLSEKLRARNKDVFFIFVDLKKAFDFVKGKLFIFPLRWKGVSGYLVNWVMSLCKGCKTVVSVDGELSSSFSVKNGVHQASALNLLLFITVMDVFTEGVRNSS